MHLHASIMVDLGSCPCLHHHVWQNSNLKGLKRFGDRVFRGDLVSACHAAPPPCAPIAARLWSLSIIQRCSIGAPLLLLSFLFAQVLHMHHTVQQEQKFVYVELETPTVPHIEFFLVEICQRRGARIIRFYVRPHLFGQDLCLLDTRAECALH